MVDRGFWLDRPCLVTGASGFVGCWLVRRLVEAGAWVVCLDQDWFPRCELVPSGAFDGITVVRGSVEDPATVERIIGGHAIDTVFHLAAQAIVGTANRDPVSTFSVNVKGTWTVLEACRLSSTVRQPIIASSDKAYGSSDTLPYVETMPLAGRHPYDVSKACADLIARSYAATYDLPVVTSRFGNFYGGGDFNWSRLVPGTIRSVIEGVRPTIRSDGLFVRDYLYVEDGAAAYMRLAEVLAGNPGLSGEAFNFSAETRSTVLDIVRRILRVMESDLEPDIRNEVMHEIPNQFMDASKARQTLGWFPLFSLTEGLHLSVEWYRAYFSARADTSG